MKDGEHELPVMDAQDLQDIIMYLDYFDEQPELQITIHGKEIDGKGINLDFEIIIQSDEHKKLFKKFLVDYARISLDSIVRCGKLWDQFR
jgi:hypothetical protein